MVDGREAVDGRETGETKETKETKETGETKETVFMRDILLQPTFLQVKLTVVTPALMMSTKLKDIFT